MAPALPKPRGPVISRLMPTMAIGQPMPPMQTIPEPVDMIGRQTGTKYAAMGDGQSPEMVHVTPTRPGTAIGDAPGEAGYAQGGSFMVGPTFGSSPGDGGWSGQSGGNGPDPESIYGAPSPYGNSGYTPSQPNYGSQGSPDPQYTQSTGTQNTWQYGPPLSSNYGQAPNINQYGGVGNQRYGPGYTQAPRYPGDPVAALYNARQAQLQSQYSGLGARSNYLNAQQNALGGQNNVLNATAATFGPQSAARAAQGNTLNLQGQQNQLQRGYLQQAGQNDQQRLQELSGIYAASQNTPDILRAGEAQNAYNSENQRDARLGVSAPATVALAPGQTTGGQPGVRGQIQTQQQALTTQAGYQDPIRQQQLALAQNAVQLQSTNVEQARIAAQQAGLTLDQANQMVSEARNQAGYGQLASQGAGIQSQFADLNTTQAGLDVNQAQQPPAPGMVPSPYPDANGQYQWMSPQEAEDARLQHVYGPGGILGQRQQAAYQNAPSEVVRLTRPELIKALKAGQIDDAAALQWYLAHNYDQESAQTALAVDKKSGGAAAIQTLDANGNPVG